MVLIHTITNRRELDEFEQLNIEGAIAWTMQKVFSKNEILSEKELIGIKSCFWAVDFTT